MQAILIVSSLVIATAAGAAEPVGTIEGVVTDGGKPVAGAVVVAVDPGAWKPTATTHSDAQGRFRFTSLAPAKYGVNATASGHTAAFDLGVAVTAGAVTRTEVKLGGDGITVSGSLVDDATGNPLTDATVVIGRISDVEGDLLAVDVKDGKFTVRLPHARFTLLANAPRHAQEALEIADASANVTLRLSGIAPAAVLDWIRARAVPLATVEAGHGFADLAPLAAAIGDARIVGLGEATHGTREFFQLKHRLLEWLVSERGFDVFGATG